MNRYPHGCLLAGLLMLAGGALGAADPTRPPAAWLTAGNDSGPARAEDAMRLQSVLLPEHGKPVAVIGGKAVALGGRFGDARLVRVTEHQAVLQGADGVTHLYLTPDVEKQMVPGPARRQRRMPGPGKEAR